MTNKSMAIIAYITIIGWIVSYLEYKKQTEQNELVRYHLGQSLGLIIISVVLSIIAGVIVGIMPSLYFISLIISVGTLVLMLLGIIAANNEVQKPLPIVGRLFEGKFQFSK